MDTSRQNGVNVSIKQAGSGQPVVLLHSSASSNKQWYLAFKTWTDRYHLVAPDLYGAGGTDNWTGPGGLTLAGNVALVTAVARKLGKPVHLVGHSYGGAVALQMALLYPELVLSLCVIEPVAFNILRDSTDTERGLFDQVSRLARDITQDVSQGFPEKAMKRFVDYWNGDGTWAGLDQDQRLKLARNAAMLPVDFSATLGEATSITAYAGITVPTLVLCGTNSPKPARQITRMLAETIPDARHRTIANAGHMLPLTHPAKVYAAIGEHLVMCQPPSRKRAA